MPEGADRVHLPRFLRDHWPSALACALGALLCIVSLHTIRLDYGPDEPDHLQYVHIIAREARLPTPQDTHSVQHPPLYFALMALPYRLGGSEVAPFSLPSGPDRLATMTTGERRSRYLCRYLQVVLTALTLLVIGAVLAQVLPTRPRVRTAVLVGVACWPLMAWGGAVVNNDMLATLWSAVLVWQGLRCVRTGQGTPAHIAAWLGLLMGLGLWVKLTVIYCAPALVALMWWHQPHWRDRMRFLLIFALVAVATGCWWYVRCALVFGDPFPNFAGPMGGEARVQAALRHDPLGAGLLFLRGAVSDLARACLLPEFLWSVAGGSAGMLALSLVEAGAVLTAAAYLACRLLRPQQRLKVTAALAGPALLAVACAVVMVIYYAITKDLRAITSGGRYMLASAVWGAILVAGAGERIALLLASAQVRRALLTSALAAELALAVGFQWLLGMWYGGIR